MNDQNAPLWHNGQTPSSSQEQPPQTAQQPVEHAKEQNKKSAKRKRSH